MSQCTDVSVDRQVEYRKLPARPDAEARALLPDITGDRLPVLAAWRRVLEGLLRPYPGSVALYVVARFLLQVLIGVLVVAVQPTTETTARTPAVLQVATTNL